MLPSAVSSVTVRVSIGPQRCPVRGCASSTVRGVHALYVGLVGLVGIVGAAVGASLDPLGQQLADRSRAADERRRAAREARAAEEGGAADSTDRTPTDDAAADASADEAPEVRHLLPSGHSTVRTSAAAVVTGVLWAAATHAVQPFLALTPFLAFLALAVAVSFTDLSHRLVPRQLLYGGLGVIVPLLVIVSAVEHTWSHLFWAAICGAAAFAVFFVIWFLVPRGMGFGDVRLSGVIGLTVGYLGVVHAYVAFLVGFVVGVVFGLVLMVGSSAGRKTRIPFAPALCIGAVVAIVWGDPLVHHVFHAGS
jgi:leader peptidase (prepilin peptidase)/N-methyltransferase